MPETFTLNMTIVLFAEALENLQHVMQINPKSQSLYILHKQYLTHRGRKGFPGQVAEESS
jgi:hypothetical protein